MTEPGTPTSANGVTYHVDRLCPQRDDVDQPCLFYEVEHYGQPGSGIIICHSHGEIVGSVTDQGGDDD